jgi:hypothetical protein
VAERLGGTGEGWVALGGLVIKGIMVGRQGNDGW